MDPKIMIVLVVVAVLLGFNYFNKKNKPAGEDNSSTEILKKNKKAERFRIFLLLIVFGIIIFALSQVNSIGGEYASENQKDKLLFLGIFAIIVGAIGALVTYDKK